MTILPLMKFFIGHRMNIASPSKDILNTTLRVMTMILILPISMEKLPFCPALIHTLKMESNLVSMNGVKTMKTISTPPSQAYR